MNKILLINPFGIGDVLFATSLIKPLKQRFPEAGLYFICNERTASVLENNSFLENVYVFEKGDYKALWRESKLKCLKKLLGFLKILKHEDFDVAIDMSLGHQYAFLLMLIGVPERIGFDYKGRGRFHTKKVPFKGFDDKSIAEYYGDLLGQIDPALRAAEETTIYMTLEDSAYIDKFIESAGIGERDRLIGIAPGGGVSFGMKNIHFKRWPEASFAGLAKRLAEDPSTKVVVIWGPGEEELATSIVDAAGVGAYMAPPTTIRQMAALMRRCCVVMANDAGPLHVAMASGTKVLAIFGPADDKVYGPYPRSERTMVATGDVKCRPCYKRFKVPDCKDRVCLTDLTVDHVYGMVNELLAR